MFAYRIVGGRPPSDAPSEPSDVVIHDTTPAPQPEPTALCLAERLKRRNQGQKLKAHPDSEDESEDKTTAAEEAKTPRRPGHDPPAWWEKTQDGIGISSSWGWRRRLVDTLWSAGPLCCWASLAAFVVLNLAVLVCEGPRYS